MDNNDIKLNRYNQQVSIEEALVNNIKDKDEREKWLSIFNKYNTSQAEINSFANEHAQILNDTEIKNFLSDMNKYDQNGDDYIDSGEAEEFIKEVLKETNPDDIQKSKEALYTFIGMLNARNIATGEGCIQLGDDCDVKDKISEQNVLTMEIPLGNEENVRMGIYIATYGDNGSFHFRYDIHIGQEESDKLPPDLDKKELLNQFIKENYGYEDSRDNDAVDFFVANSIRGTTKGPDGTYKIDFVPTINKTDEINDVSRVNAIKNLYPGATKEMLVKDNILTHYLFVQSDLVSALGDIGVVDYALGTTTKLNAYTFAASMGVGSYLMEYIGATKGAYDFSNKAGKIADILRKYRANPSLYETEEFSEDFKAIFGKEFDYDKALEFYNITEKYINSKSIFDAYNAVSEAIKPLAYHYGYYDRKNSFGNFPSQQNWLVDWNSIPNAYEIYEYYAKQSGEDVKPKEYFEQNPRELLDIMVKLREGISKQLDNLGYNIIHNGSDTQGKYTNKEYAKLEEQYLKDFKNLYGIDPPAAFIEELNTSKQFGSFAKMGLLVFASYFGGSAVFVAGDVLLEVLNDSTKANPDLDYKKYGIIIASDTLFMGLGKVFSPIGKFVGDRMSNFIGNGLKCTGKDLLASIAGKVGEVGTNVTIFSGVNSVLTGENLSDAFSETGGMEIVNRCAAFLAGAIGKNGKPIICDPVEIKKWEFAKIQSGVEKWQIYCDKTNRFFIRIGDKIVEKYESGERVFYRICDQISNTYKRLFSERTESAAGQESYTSGSSPETAIGIHNVVVTGNKVNNIKPDGKPVSVEENDIINIDSKINIDIGSYAEGLANGQTVYIDMAGKTYKTNPDCECIELTRNNKGKLEVKNLNIEQQTIVNEAKTETELNENDEIRLGNTDIDLNPYKEIIRNLPSDGKTKLYIDETGKLSSTKPKRKTTYVEISKNNEGKVIVKSHNATMMVKREGNTYHSNGESRSIPVQGDNGALNSQLTEIQEKLLNELDAGTLKGRQIAILMDNGFKIKLNDDGTFNITFGEKSYSNVSVEMNNKDLLNFYKKSMPQEAQKVINKRGKNPLQQSDIWELKKAGVDIRIENGNIIYKYDGRDVILGELDSAHHIKTVTISSKNVVNGGHAAEAYTNLGDFCVESGTKSSNASGDVYTIQVENVKSVLQKMGIEINKEHIVTIEYYPSEHDSKGNRFGNFEINYKNGTKLVLISVCDNPSNPTKVTRYERKIIDSVEKACGSKDVIDSETLMKAHDYIANVDEGTMQNFINQYEVAKQLSLRDPNGITKQKKDGKIRIRIDNQYFEITTKADGSTASFYPIDPSETAVKIPYIEIDRVTGVVTPRIY